MIKHPIHLYRASVSIGNDAKDTKAVQQIDNMLSKLERLWEGAGRYSFLCFIHYLLLVPRYYVFMNLNLF